MTYSRKVFLDTNDGMKTPGVIGLVVLLVIDPLK